MAASFQLAGLPRQVGNLPPQGKPHSSDASEKRPHEDHRGMSPRIGRRPGSSLVSDFDGTMTRHDFYRLTLDELVPPDIRPLRGLSRRSENALRSAASDLRGDSGRRGGRADVVRQSGAGSGLAEGLARLRGAGWEIVVASAGCAGISSRLLSDAGVALEVNASPGRFQAGKDCGWNCRPARRTFRRPTGSTRPRWSVGPAVGPAGSFRRRRRPGPGRRAPGIRGVALARADLARRCTARAWRSDRSSAGPTSPLLWPVQGRTDEGRRWPTTSNRNQRRLVQHQGFSCSAAAAPTVRSCAGRTD